MATLGIKDIAALANVSPATVSIPVSLEAAASLAALTHPNHLVRLGSWG